MTELEVRFWRKVSFSIGATGCWLWTGGKNHDGYGKFQYDRRIGGIMQTRSAHVFAYHVRRGVVPVGLELDHICSNRACVNPSHLEPVTHAENVRRGRMAKVTSDLRRARTHCPRGHEYTPENTYLQRGNRSCKECRKALNNANNAKRKLQRQEKGTTC